MQVAKWGNSLAIRLPAAVVKALNLNEGDEIEVSVSDNADAMKVRRKGTFEDYLTLFDEFRGGLPDDFKFDRDEANAR